MALREIIAKFGFDYDQTKLKQINSDVESTKGIISTAVTLLAGAALFHGIKSFVEGIERTGSALNDLSEQTGISAKNIQLFQFGAGLAGVETDELNAALRKLSLATGKAGDGADAQAGAFAALGVQTKDVSGDTRSLNDLLPEIVAGFGGIEDPTKKAQLAVDLFGRSGVKLVGFLSQGAEGLNALRDEFDALGGGFTDDAVKAADDYGDNLTRLNLASTSFKAIVGNEVLPILSKIVLFMAKGVAKFKQFAEKTELAKGTMIALGVAGAIAIGSLLLPFAPLIATVTALSLAFDDLLSFLNGEDSVIGEALNEFLGAGSASKIREQLVEIDKQVKEFFTGLIDHPKKFFSDLEKLADDYVNSSPLLKLISGGKGARGLLGGQTDDPFSMNSTADPLGGFTDTKAIGNLLDVAKANLTEAGKGYQQQLAPNAQPQEPDWFARLSDKLFGGFAGGAPALANVPGSMPSAAVAVPGVPTNQIDQQNRINITVQAGTPDETTRAIEDGATRALGNERRAALAALEQGTK